MIHRALCLLALIAFHAAPARAADPYPPALAVAFIAEPAPIVQEGMTKLYYEMLVTNFAPIPYVIEAIDAEAGATKARFDDTALAPMIRKLGGKPGADKGAERTIEGGRSAVVFLELDLGKAKAPTSIAQVLHVLDDKGEPAARAATLPVGETGVCKGQQNPRGLGAGAQGAAEEPRPG